MADDTTQDESTATTATFTHAAKDYANPIAQSEQGVADRLRKVERIATEHIPVFANTQEGASEYLQRAIAQGTTQCITVSLSELTDVVHPVRGVYLDNTAVSYSTIAQCTLRVSIIAPAILSSTRISATTDLGFTVLRALDGERFTHPFLTVLEFTGWEQDEQNGVFSSTLTFTARLGLTEILRG